MYNYDATATHNNGNCIPIVSGCVSDPTASNFNQNANTDDGSCIISGCTDATATNHNSLATNDNGSCEYSPIDCWSPCADDGTGSWDSLNTPSTTGSCPTGFTSTVPSCVTPTSGCMDPLGDNFDGSATIDDGSCTYTEFTCYDDAQSCPDNQ